MHNHFRYPIRVLATALGLVLLACSTSATPHAAGEPAPEPAPRGYWTDPATHLTWAAKDNGYPVTWEMAKTYCANLTTAGYHWTLPTIEQLESVYYVGENEYNHPVKGNIKLTADYEWSSTSAGSGSAWAFSFVVGKRGQYNSDGSDAPRALCVRRSGE